jgi:hypothetical protein
MAKKSIMFYTCPIIPSNLFLQHISSGNFTKYRSFSTIRKHEENPLITMEEV